MLSCTDLWSLRNATTCLAHWKQGLQDMNHVTWYFSPRGRFRAEKAGWVLNQFKKQISVWTGFLG